MTLELLKISSATCFALTMNGRQWQRLAQNAGVNASHAFAPRRSNILHRRIAQVRVGVDRYHTTSALSERHALPLYAVVADGTREYAGKVTSRLKKGALIDFGAECHGFLSCDGLEDGPKVGEDVVIYPVRKWGTGAAARVHVSMQPSTQPRIRWSDLHADGVTPLKGRVESVDHAAGGAFIDVGSEICGRIPHAELEMHSGPPLIEGSEIIVYLMNKDQRRSKLDLSLQPVLIPRTAWESLVPDGQTPYRGRVVRAVATASAYLVDINSEALGFLPAAEVKEGLVNNQEVTVYVCRKDRKTKRIKLTLQRRAKPLQRWEAILADGVSPYMGYVSSKVDFGVFVDLGAEVMGLLPANGFWATEQHELDQLEIHQQVTVFAVQKMAKTGKLTVRLKPLPSALLPLADVCADGITPHKGTIYAVGPFGLFVHFGAQNVGLLYEAKADEPILFEHRRSEFVDRGLAEGSPVDVYVVRKNPASDKIELSLRPATSRRLSISEVQVGKIYSGTVYNVSFNEVLVDIGCEVSGSVPRHAASAVSRSDRISVQPIGFNREKGRFNLQLATMVEKRHDHKSESDSGDAHEDFEVRWVAEGSQAGGVTRFICRATGQEVSRLPAIGWVEVRTHGTPYYWNLKSGETSWLPPQNNHRSRQNG